VWPLDPDGEILVVLMIEDTVGIANLPDILANVPGVGAVLVGEGDLSQELGHPREYQHPEVLAAVAEVVATGRRFGVPVGHPHVTEQNVERLLGEGFRILMPAPLRSYAPLDKGLSLTGRA
jgi:4-hydroxy-2-oxoheptanedioate aldolase